MALVIPALGSRLAPALGPAREQHREDDVLLPSPFLLLVVLLRVLRVLRASVLILSRVLRPPRYLSSDTLLFQCTSSRAG
jgi:hypothetical protein